MENKKQNVERLWYTSLWSYKRCMGEWSVQTSAFLSFHPGATLSAAMRVNSAKNDKPETQMESLFLFRRGAKTAGYTFVARMWLVR